MPDVALIYPYQYKHVRSAMLFHPLGIAQLSAVLRGDGIDTLVMTVKGYGRGPKSPDGWWQGGASVFKAR